jgi:hypothetical protein
LIVGLATLCSMPAMGHPPSLQDCFEGGDFIANAAHARENGMPKSVFIDRLVADVYAIQAFPRAAALVRCRSRGCRVPAGRGVERVRSSSAA